MHVVISEMLRNVFLFLFVIKVKGRDQSVCMEQLPLFRQEGLLELDGLLLQVGESRELLLLGAAHRLQPMNGVGPLRHLRG